MEDHKAFQIEYSNKIELEKNSLIFFLLTFVYIFILCSEAIIEPAAIFAMLFGSELFEAYIGQLAMASMASLDIFTEGEQLDTKKLQEKMRVRSNSIPLFIIN